MSMLTELRNRGVQDALVVCCDGLKGLPDALRVTWPQATVQACVVHLVRNGLRYASTKHLGQTTRQLKAIYTAATVQAVEGRFAGFSEEWKPDPAMIASWGSRRDERSHTTPEPPRPGRKDRRVETDPRCPHNSLRAPTRDQSVKQDFKQQTATAIYTNDLTDPGETDQDGRERAHLDSSIERWVAGILDGPQTESSGGFCHAVDAIVFDRHLGVPCRRPGDRAPTRAGAGWEGNG